VTNVARITVGNTRDNRRLCGRPAGRYNGTGRAVPAMTLTELQELIRTTFGAKDSRRGVEGTFLWFMEEIGELATALRDGTPKPELAAEFADVLAWLATLANIAGVDLDEAVRTKYGVGCPSCRRVPCACSPTEKP
jgi:NTP pyrophosphatase (non-canonical NTP hydrolase)